jgi:hypothetical protein
MSIRAQHKHPVGRWTVHRWTDKSDPYPWQVLRSGGDGEHWADGATYATQAEAFAIALVASIYHAPDCAGFPFCDGCGWIDGDGGWHAGPCPEYDKPYQEERSEGR